MDPQAAWLAMLQALIDDDLASASEHANALIDWLDRGGFSPIVLPELGPAACDPKSPAYQLDYLIVSEVCARIRTAAQT